MKTARGFEVKHFKDTYGMDCSIQESSSAEEPKIWLGVHSAPVKVMWKDVPKFLESVKGIGKDCPETNERGWCTVNLPDEALVESRMHLNQEQAKWLVKELEYFIEHGYLKDEDEAQTDERSNS